MSTTPKPKRKPEVIVPDHHIPLAQFVKQYGVPGQVPVDVEGMLERAGITLRRVVTQKRNGVKLVEIGNGLSLTIFINAKESMYSSVQRTAVATTFALFLSNAPKDRWEWFDNHSGQTHNDPHDIYAQRFALELLVPMTSLREFLKDKLPMPRRQVFQSIADQYDVPLFYAVQRVSYLEYLIEQEQKR